MENQDSERVMIGKCGEVFEEVKRQYPNINPTYESYLARVSAEAEYQKRAFLLTSPPGVDIRKY